MAKGDDALRKKKNKISRKRMRNSESAVSARIAAIIASKHRRKSGKRRICEGMCFSLPTPEDPFNDRYNKKNFKDDKPKPKPKPKENLRLNKKEPQLLQPLRTCQQQHKDKDKESEQPAHKFEDGCLSKYITLCLNAIQNAWNEEEEEDGGVSSSGVGADRSHLLASSWGAELWRRCSSGCSVVDSSGGCASKEQLAWLLSTASDIIARKEKQGEAVPSPFLLFIVPSQQKAIQVRSVCKPLKALGIHTVSLHPGASIDHQIQGLKSCEPEFLVSTPDRLLELVHLRAIDISTVSLLVFDGLKSMVDLGFSDEVKSIKENISEQPQVVVFSDCYEEISGSLFQSLLKEPVCKLSLDESMLCQSDCYEEISGSLFQSLLKEPVCKLSLDESMLCQSAFISQHSHVYSSENERTSKGEGCNNPQGGDNR